MMPNYGARTTSQAMEDLLVAVQRFIETSDEYASSEIPETDQGFADGKLVRFLYATRELRLAANNAKEFLA